MVDRLVAVNDADYRLPDPVLQAIAGDVGNVSSDLGGAVDTQFQISRVSTMNLRKVVTPSGVDDTAAVNAALAAFAGAGGGKVIIPRDNWKFTGATGLTLINTSSPIHIEAEEGTVFDMTGLSAAIGINLGGSVTGSSAALGADAAVLDVAITCALTVVPGDIIRLQSTDLFTPGLGTAVKGELAEVLSTSGGTILLKSPLWDSYTAATTTVTLMQMPRVSVENLSVIRNGTNTGLQLKYARNAVLGGMYGEGARDRLFAVSDALGVTVDNVTGRDFYASGSGTSYGLSVSSSQEVTEIGNNLKGGRHAVAHGGSYPIRDVQVVGGTYDNYHPGGQAAFDFHPNCENVRMIGVTVLNGIVSGASNFEATDCTIRTGTGTARTGMELGLWQSSEYVKVKDCDIRIGHAGSDAVHIINRGGATASLTKLVHIDGSIRTGATGSGVRVSPNTSADTGATIERLEISGDIRGGAGGVVLQKSGAAELVAKDIRISGRVAASGGHAVTVTTTGQERMEYDHADVVTGMAARAAHNVAAGTHEMVIRHSRLIASANNGDRNYFGSGRLTIVDSSVEGFTANGGVSAATASEALINNVQSISNAGSMSLPPRHYSRKNAAGKVTTHGTVAPTTGTWAVGDRSENTAPASGSPAGWVCTVAGTPGTWLPLPNL